MLANFNHESSLQRVARHTEHTTANTRECLSLASHNVCQRYATIDCKEENRLVAPLDCFHYFLVY